MAFAERLKRLRYAVAPIVLLGLAVMPMARAPLQAQTGAKENALCWAPDQLAAKAGEEKIKRAGRSGLMIVPPKRSPISAPAEKSLAIRRVKLPKGKKLVALTFDLCEQPYEIAGYQGDIVDFLRAHRIKATFFAGGKWMLTHKLRTEQLMADPLFEMGNHTWEHRNLRLLTGDALKTEIASTQTAYEAVREELEKQQCLSADGRKPAYKGAAKRLGLFRFPFGACNAESLAAVGGLGLRAIQWDVSSGDPSPGTSSERMVQGVRAEVKPGSIVLFHANGRGWHTAGALPQLVKDLKEKGYQFVTVSELLAAGEPEYTDICYDSRPGDTDRYDKLALRLSKAYERWRTKILSSAVAPDGVPPPRPAKKPGADKEP